jgi:hypothetical protein
VEKCPTFNKDGWRKGNAVISSEVGTYGFRSRRLIGRAS